MAQRKLTEAEHAALSAAWRNPLACDDLPARSSTDLWGFPVPGKKTYASLERLGLLVLPEEVPVMVEGLDEPFTFTAFVELTDAGKAALKCGMIDTPEPASHGSGLEPS